MASLLWYNLEHVDDLPCYSAKHGNWKIYTDLTIQLRYMASEFHKLDTSFSCAVWYSRRSCGFSVNSILMLLQGITKQAWHYYSTQTKLWCLFRQQWKINPVLPSVQELTEHFAEESRWDTQLTKTVLHWILPDFISEKLELPIFQKYCAKHHFCPDLHKPHLKTGVVWDKDMIIYLFYKTLRNLHSWNYHKKQQFWSSLLLLNDLLKCVQWIWNITTLHQTSTLFSSQNPQQFLTEIKLKTGLFKWNVFAPIKLLKNICVHPEHSKNILSHQTVFVNQIKCLLQWQPVLLLPLWPSLAGQNKSWTELR